MSSVRRSPRFVRDENRIMGNESSEQHDMLVSDMFSPPKQQAAKKSASTVATKKRASLSNTNTPSSGKKSVNKKNRRETADMEDLMNNLLDDSSFTVQSDFSLTSPAVPVPESGKKKATTGNGKATTGKKKAADRRETMDQGNSMLNDLLNDSDTFKDSVAVDDNARRMTMNASCMDDLLNDLDSSNTSSFSAQSGTGRLSILLQSADKKKQPQSAGKNVARLSIQAVNNFLDLSDGEL